MGLTRLWYVCVWVGGVTSMRRLGLGWVRYRGPAAAAAANAGGEVIVDQRRCRACRRRV